MPRGIKKGKIVEMNEAELETIEQPIIPEKKVEVVGSLSKPKISGDEDKARKEAQKLFPKIAVKYDDWIEMTNEEAIEYQVQGILVGHDANQGIGLLKKRK